MPKFDLSLLDHFDQKFLGFESLFRDFPIQTSYPPHNVIRKSDKELVLEIAIAGFKKDEIKLEEKDGLLTVTGKKSTENDDNIEYQYRGLASRTFVKSFRIAEFFEVVEAKLEDGILTILLTKNEPEVQSKFIPIK